MKLFGLGNASLLARMYLFILAGSISVGLTAQNFGRVRDRLSKDSRPAKILHWAVLSQVSEWHAYLSPVFRSVPGNYSIAVDVMTKGGELYRGEVQELYLAPDGDLQTIVLKEGEQFRRTEYARDVAKFYALPEPTPALLPSSRNYWAKIPGIGFFILGSDVSTVNGRQVSLFSSVDQDAELAKVLSELTDLLNQKRQE